MFPAITELAVAERHIRWGATVALATALLGLLVVSVAMATGATGFWSFWNDPWGLVEVALTLVLAFAIWRRSRVAAGAIIVHFIACRAYLWTTLKTPSPLGILLACVIFAFYWNALRGTIAYHRLRRAAEPGYRTFRIWHLVIWIPAGALGLIILGLSIFSIFTPPNAVLEGGSLKQRDEAFLREQAIVEPDEMILLFVEDDGDERFIRDLRKAWRAARSLRDGR